MPASTVWRIGLAGLLASLLFAFAPTLDSDGFQVPLLPAPAAAEGLIASASTCPDHSAIGGGRKMAEARSAMACMVNYARRKRGLRKYHRRRKLDWSANRKGADILRCDAFSHNACGRNFDHWIRRSGFLRRNRGWSTGENIAWGSGRLGNVRAIFKAWMRSPGHRRAILDRTYRNFGIGVARGRMRGLAGARVWVLHFARIY